MWEFLHSDLFIVYICPVLLMICFVWAYINKLRRKHATWKRKVEKKRQEEYIFWRNRSR